ncbi:RHS repeat domain-containing protein [Pseudoxanthomonas sp. LARHCG66]
MTGGLDLTYGYDAVGNLVDIDSGSSPPMEYRYDALGRLTEALDGPAQAVLDKYEYDKTGNRISYTDSFGTKAYAYPANSHRLDSVAGENRAYDAVGNTLSIGASREFEYNDAGRMSRVRNGGVLAMEYAYSGRGEQVRRHLGASETQALYDEAGHWLGNYGTSGVVSQQAIWMDDMPVGVTEGGRPYYIEPDHLGTPRAVVDPTRDVSVWAWDMKGEGFGSTPPESDPDADGVPLPLDMRFPGQLYDEASLFNYNYFRDFETETGRFIESDPIGLKGGLSTYSYVDGNPLQGLDPLGLHNGRNRGGPYHSPASTKCYRTDTCPMLKAKMHEFQRMITSHEGWDRANPAPRGGNRHAEEIGQLWTGYANCEEIYRSKNCDNCPTPSPGPVFATPPVRFKPGAAGKPVPTPAAISPAFPTIFLMVCLPCTQMLQPGPPPPPPT